MLLLSSLSHSLEPTCRIHGLRPGVWNSTDFGSILVGHQQDPNTDAYHYGFQSEHDPVDPDCVLYLETLYEEEEEEDFNDADGRRHSNGTEESVKLSDLDGGFPAERLWPEILMSPQT